MTVTVDEAARAGGSAGLLGEREPEGFNKWPAAAKTAFHDQYARGRFCRRVAEGRATPLSHEPPSNSRYAQMTRVQLVSEYRSRPDLQSEFNSADIFVAFVTASLAGRAHIHRGRVVS